MKTELLFEAYRSEPTRESLEQLLRAYANTVYNLCYQILLHPQNAEDASQKVFLEIMRRMDKIKNGDHFKRSLIRMSFHVALNEKRSSKTRLGYERETASMRSSDQNPGGEPETLAALHEHVARLDDELQNLVVDYYFGDKNLERLAAERGCSTVTVWKRLEKAKEALRKSLVGAGLAGLASLAGSTLEAMTPVPAPDSLLTPALVAKAFALRSAGGAAVIPALGGWILKKYALISAAFALLVVGVAGYASVRARKQSEPPHRPSTAKALTVPPEREAGKLAPSSATEIAVLRFPSAKAFRQEYLKAIRLASDSERVKELRRLGISLSDADFRAVLGVSRGKRGGNKFAHYFSAALLSTWIEKDLLGAARLFRDLPLDPEEPYYETLSKTGLVPSRDYRHNMLRDVIVQWAKKDCAAARQFVDTVPVEDRADLLNCILARSDPAGLSQTVLSLSEKERASAMRALAESWGEQNPREALRWGELLSIPSNQSTREGYLEAEMRWGFLEGAVAVWARAHPEDALSWVQAAPERRGLLVPLIEEVARTAPQAAVDLVDRNLASSPSGMPYFSALKSIAFLHPDPNAAVDLLEAHRPADPSGAMNDLLKLFITAWARDDDPETAMRWAMDHRDAMQRSVLVIAAAVGRATSPEQDVVGAMATLKTLPEDLRARGAGQVFAAYARSRPEDATALAQGFQQPIPVMEIATELARQDIESALVWARSVPDESTRDKALSVLCAGPLGLCWQKRDVSRAIASAGEIRDPSIQMHTQGEIARYWAARGDPETVANWVMTLSARTFPAPQDKQDWIYHTGNSREQILTTVIGMWTGQDDQRERARRWVEQSSLTEESKSRLLRRIAERKR
jgi:RNA polymerase sigma-70 factor (ECF subfamily)